MKFSPHPNPLPDGERGRVRGHCLPAVRHGSVPAGSAESNDEAKSTRTFHCLRLFPDEYGTLAGGDEPVQGLLVQFNAEPGTGGNPGITLFNLRPAN